MTTLKEYKAMMEEMMRAGNLLKSPPDRISEHVNFSCESLQIAPTLIRVIGLAEEALDSCDYMEGEDRFDHQLVNNALSEIRKLKGE